MKKNKKRLEVKKEENLKEKVKKIIKIFEKIYPDARCSLNFRNPYELIVATILSAQCTDERVNLVTPNLFKKYSNFFELEKADLGELENIIRPTGFYKNKAKSLVEMAKKVVHDFNGELPKTISELTTLAGVGRKTANVVLGNAFNINEGIVVDTHVKRLSYRIGLTQNKTPEKIEIDLMKIVPQNKWTIFSHYLVFHGRKRCMARKPDCLNCEIEKFCNKNF
jgi:endonuclease-3